MSERRLVILSWATIIFLVLGENAHLIFQHISGMDLLPEGPEQDRLYHLYYIVTDFSSYAVKAYMGGICFLLIYKFHRNRGLLTLWIIAPLYYLLDTFNTLITGNYDGLVPMLVCMGIGVLLGTLFYFWDREPEEEEKCDDYRRNEIGF